MWCTSQHKPVKITLLTGIVIGISLMHDATVVPHDDITFMPDVTILIFFLSGVRHQFGDQREGFLIVHADDVLHVRGVQIKCPAAVLGMHYHQRLNGFGSFLFFIFC
jgi:hypothetical protein